MLMTEKKYKFWFCTGSQDLYGDECLAHVAKHSQIIVEELNKSGRLPFELVWKPTLITNEVIRKTFNEANQDAQALSPGCILFHRLKAGSWDYRNITSLYAICIPSLTRRSLMSPLIWIS